MYWPLGTPRIYAAKHPPDSSPPAYDSDDGSGELIQNSPSLLLRDDNDNDDDDDDYEKVNNEDGEGDDDDGENSQEGKKVGEKEVMDQELREAPPPPPPRSMGKGTDQKIRNQPTGGKEEERKKHILSLKVARSGMLFATITASELTIWQMKVGETSGQVGKLRSEC